MKLFRGGIVVASLALFSLPAWGQDTYTGGDTGTFEDPGNYNNGSPDGQDVVFSPSTSTTYNITQDSSDTISGLTVNGGGTVDFNSGGNSLTVTGGTPSGSGPVNIAINGGSTFNYSGGSFIFDNGEFNVGDSGGNGTFNLLTGTLNYDQQPSADSTSLNVGKEGGIGIFNQAGGTTVTTGEQVEIGSNGGTGTYTMSGSSTLQTGTMLSSYFVAVGIGTPTNTAGTGMLVLNDNSTLDLNAGGRLLLGAYFTIIGSTATASSVSSVGTVTQNDSSTVNLEGTSTDLAYLIAGSYTGATGTYNLKGGTLNANDYSEVILGRDGDSTGTFNQSGGTFNTASDTIFIVGDSGTGTYNLSGGTANIVSGIQVGGVFTKGLGTLNQSGGTLTSTGASGIGGASGSTPGIYNMSGGTATYNGGLYVGATGTVNQTGGTIIAPNGETVDLSSVGSSYNLNGGTLEAYSLTGTTGQGTLNFGGGTLEGAPTSNPLYDNLDGTVSGNSTLSTDNSTIVLDGSLTGSGGFTITGSNGAAIDLDTVTYTGATDVQSSALDVYTNSTSAGTFRFVSPISGTSDSSLVLDSFLAGSTIQLTGTLDFLGTTLLQGGDTLQVYNGTLGPVDDYISAGANLIVGQDGTDSTAPLTGTVNITGTDIYSYNGSTTVYSNFTLKAPSLFSSDVTNNGTLGNNGAVGSTFYVGTPAAGAGTGTLDMPFEMSGTAAEGTLLERVAGNVADTYSAGTLNLYGGVSLSGYSAIGTTNYVLASATATRTTGTLNSPTNDGFYIVQANSALLSATLSYNSTANDVYIDITQKPISTYATTPNEQAAANALDAALASPTNAGSSIFTSLDNLTSGAAVSNALDQLGPRPYLYLRDIAFENATFMAENVDGHLAAIRQGFSGLDASGLSIVAPGFDSGLARSLGSMFAYNGEGVAPNGVNYYPDENVTPVPSSPPSSLTMPEPTQDVISDTPRSQMMATPTPTSMPSSSIFSSPNFSEFLSGDLILGDLNQNNNENIPDAHYKAANVTGGIAFKVTPHLAAGLLFDYNHTEANTDAQGSHVRVDTYSPGAYATFFEKGFYANGLFTFGYDDYSANRVLSFGGAGATAHSSPTGQQYVGNIDFGYDFHPGKDRQFTVGPDLGLTYTHLDVDSFTETGAGPADLSVSSQSADSLRGRIGGHLFYRFLAGSILLQPNLFAAYQYEFLNDPFGLTSQFDIPGTTPFTINGANPGRSSALVGVGLSATFSNAMVLYLNYLAEVGADDYLVQSVQGGLKASF